MRRGAKKAGGLLGMPRWLSDTMSAIGLSTVIYVLVKYTFVGEIIERVYAQAVGRSPIDEIETGLETAGDAIATDLRQTARELDGEQV